jgi:hypothetical protein
MPAKQANAPLASHLNCSRRSQAAARASSSASNPAAASATVAPHDRVFRTDGTLRPYRSGNVTTRRGTPAPGFGRRAGDSYAEQLTPPAVRDKGSFWPNGPQR